jgi:catechol 2,3-dioxygenase-like lactoylglutathione lyase family enzyme
MNNLIIVMSLVAALTASAVAQSAPTRALPLDNLGLEHLDIVVPDPAASARFYSRIFGSALHQQPVRDSLRYFILLGDLPSNRQVGYIAIGAAAGRTPAIGHYALKVAPFDRAALIARLRDLGARVLDAADEPDVVRFADDNGIVVEVRVAQ